MTFELRRAVADDAAALTDVAHPAYAVYLPRMPRGLRPGPMHTDYAHALDRAEVWVAEREGRVAAFLVLAAGRDHLLLENVAVRPEFQGQALGHRLLALAEDRARAQGFMRVELFTHAVMIENQRLYARLGYVETHRTSEHGFDRVFFTKRL